MWKAEEIGVGLAYLGLIMGIVVWSRVFVVFLVQHYSYRKRSHNTREVHLSKK